jgi:hypothetical protein
MKLKPHLPVFPRNCLLHKILQQNVKHTLHALQLSLAISGDVDIDHLAAM